MPAARLRLSSGLMRWTFQTRLVASIPRISHDDRSNCHHSIPWKAERGKAWWLLCQPSPKANRPTSQLLRLASLVAYGRPPNVWQIELTLQVTWCVRQMRTSPPHSRPLQPPIANGMATPKMPQIHQVRSTQTTRGSFFNHEPYVSGSATSRKTQPTWA